MEPVLQNTDDSLIVETKIEEPIVPVETKVEEPTVETKDEEPVETKVEEPIVVTVETKVEEPVVASVETKVEEPVATHVETKVEEPVETKVEEPVETKVEEPVITPVETKVEEPAVVAPVETRVEEPVETKVEEPAVLTPVETKVEDPAVVTPVETKVEEPAVVAPAETKVEAVVTPVETKVEPAVVVPAETKVEPAVISVEATSSASPSPSSTPLQSSPRLQNDMKEYFDHENFHLQGWLWAHISIKRVYELVENKLNRGFEPKNRKEIDDFVRAVQTTADYLHSHHDHEEDFVWDWIKTFDPSTEVTLNLMDRQHGEWIEKNKELETILNKMRNNKSIENSTSEGFKEWVDELKVNVKFQCDVIYSHFYDEERLLIPTALKIPKEGQQKVGKMIHDRIQKESNKNFSLCCMIDTAKHDPVFAESFNKTLPWFVRKVIGGLLWKKEYKWFLECLEK